MRPLVVVAGGAVAALGASTLLEVREADHDEEYRANALGYLYAGGLTLVGLGVFVAGLLL
ncbi:MAG: hypothetical protein ABEJ68_11335 [Halobacteriaceae archaeon]